MKKTFGLRIVLALAVVASVGLLSCSKKQGDVPSGGLLESALLAKIPSSSLLFMTANMSSGAFKNFQSSPWAYNPVELLAKIDKLAEQSTDPLPRVFLKAVKATGFIRDQNTKDEPLSEIVAFAGLDEGTKLPFGGGYFSAAAGKELKSSVHKVQQSLKADGIQVKDDTIAGNPAIEISIGNGAAIPGMPLASIFFAASDSFAAISNSRMAVERAFGQAKDGLSKLNASPEFARARAILPDSDEQLSVSYIALKDIIALAAQFLPPMGEGPDLKTVPLDGFLISARMSDTPSYLIAALTSAKTPNQDKIISNLTGGNAGDPLRQAPADSSFMLGLDGALLAGIKAVALENSPPDQQPMLREMLKPLDGVKSLGLGVIGASGMSPFPGVLLSINTPNGDALAGALKENLSGAVASSGMPVSDWQEKEIEGSKVTFIQSPMVGLGVFVARSAGGVMLGSSEEVIKSVILAGKSSSAALGGGLSEDSQRLIKDTRSIFAAYGNFDRIADAIDSVQGSMSAFTGGQNMVDAEMSKNLRKVGIMVTSASFDSGVLKIESSYSASPKKAG